MIRVVQKPCPRQNWRPGTIPRAVRAVVVHVVEGSAAACDAWFANPLAEVSAHFLVTRAGTVHQYVGVHDIAYHAGRVLKPTWPGLVPTMNPNAYTVGIEHEGTGREPWTEAQLTASAIVASWVCQRFGLEPSEKTLPMHREIFAAKSCPGPAFDRAAYVDAVHALDCAGLTSLITGIR